MIDGGESALRALRIALVAGLLAGVASTAGAETEILLAQTDDEAAEPASESAPSERPKAPARGIEEIVVRGAESDATSDFEAADSVTGFGAEDLQALGAQNIADIAAFTPNLEIVTSGATTPTFFIRGVGLNDFNSNSTGAVAIYQDDVARNAPALQLSTLYDIEAVNVLRGPQGTGLARNASAGAIKIYSRKPTGEFGAFLRSDGGNYDFRDFEGAVEAPIYEDILSARFAFRFTQRDGTMKNRCGGAPPFDQRVPVPSGTVQQLFGLTNTDPPWSICGEAVEFLTDNDGPDGPAPPGISPVPPGLADRVNNLNNWAARGTLLFQPTLDSTWLIGASGSRRDEYSRLGQSIGTGGFTCMDDDVDNCGQPTANNPNTSFIRGTLGGVQGLVNAGYVPPEIRARLIELSPCNQPIPRTLPQFPAGLTAAMRCQRPIDPYTGIDQRTIDNQAKMKLAKELARNLDSDPWAGDFNETGKTTNDIWGVYLKGDTVFPDLGAQLTTVSAYDTYDREILIDLDFSPETLFQINTIDDGWQFYQDVKLQGEVGNEGAIRWDLGSWFLREQLNVMVINNLGILSPFGVGQRQYVQDVYSTAGYLSLAFDFWNDFTLDGGFRYNWEQKKIDYNLMSAICTDMNPCNEKLNNTWSAPTGTVRLTYRFREDTHVFWKYTRGFKPGTYNATSSPEQGISVANQEQIDAFETGVRGSWLDGRVGIDTSLFYYTYKDYQLFTAQQFAGGQPEFVILNAKSAEVYGAEVDAVLRPWSGSFFNVRLGWLETQFLDFVQIQQAIEVVLGTQTIVNRELQNTGNRLLNSPQFKVSITAEQTVPLGKWGSVTARYDGVWTDETFYDATEGRGIPNNENIQFLPKHTTSQVAYWLHNVRFSYRPPGDRVEIAGWVRNLTNEAYKTFAFDASTFNRTSIYFVGDPRTYGLSVNVTF